MTIITRCCSGSLLMLGAMAGLVALPAGASERYFTYIDETGKIRNLFLDDDFKEQQDEVRHRISLSSYIDPYDNPSSIAYQNFSSSSEKKRRYFTWVDADGTVQSSFYSDQSDIKPRDQYVLGSGERASSYVDADVLEGRGFVRGENGQPYYTWTDAEGRIQNTAITTEQRAQAFKRPRLPGIGSRNHDFTDGNELLLKAMPAPVSQNIALSPELAGILDANREQRRQPQRARDAELAQAFSDGCCIQMDVRNFEKPGLDQAKYDEFNRFTPLFDFPTGLSYYSGYVIPDDKPSSAVRVRSFSNQDVMYPSLLFLDAARRPTRLVTDAIYRLNPETWHSYAYIEGIVALKPWLGERYVVVMTTEEALEQQTLDNKPFARPLDMKSVAVEEGMVVREHASTGSFEVTFLK
ncbi:MalM family protein [Kistimonas asteriae]|uniref:MalM family protein n=1 Tax=Kistimonas asteriae TaxID=517724 RepID=UPI001BA852A6|nr:MalM family protein [Kistimonas asteriae]